MVSTVIRVNERELAVLTTALAKYNAELIVGTKSGPKVMTEEFKHIANLLGKLANARTNLNRSI